MARLFAGTLVLLALASTVAHARIVCSEGYQVINGRNVATPYCGDNYLAQVAREYGYKVSNAAVRNSPSLKDAICRHIGGDIRINEYCDVDEGFDAGW